MSRGGLREAIFQDDLDRERFLATPRRGLPQDGLAGSCGVPDEVVEIAV